MIRKIDETSTDSWLQRAPGAGELEAGTRVETFSAALAPADRSQGGWDPMEVWLRYIERPRRLRQHAKTTARQRRG
jgi:hypothetical protein